MRSIKQCRLSITVGIRGKQQAQSSSLQKHRQDTLHNHHNNYRKVLQDLNQNQVK
jgi:hypothetical protein